ncbi:unnamed protein product [Rhodiola kirilowii]
MDETDDDRHFFRPAHSALVSLSPFTPFPASSPASRRLSSQFVERSKPVQASRKLAWMSLQGRIVGAEEASSARSIGGGLSKEEAVAWEMFSPMHRILIVAVVAVASAQSSKNREIRRLKQSVELRDQVLTIMQQKLDNLCEQVNYFKDQPLGGVNMLSLKSEKIITDEASEGEKTNANGINGLGCRRDSLSSVCTVDTSRRAYGDYDISHSEHPIHSVDLQEERRLSGLSDWSSAVTSSSDFQLVSLDQNLQNLRHQCQEKDAMIQELSQHIKSLDAGSSKRIAELEDVIRRKNSRVLKLQKDMVVLEQKVMQLTRARRPSTSKSTPISRKVPFMSENVLYDMDSTTGPSSDSDCSRENKPPMARKSHNSNKGKAFVTTRRDYKASRTESPISSFKVVDYSRSAGPLQEISENQRPSSSERPKHSHVTEDLKKMRRRQPPSGAGFGSGLRNANSSKRWV